MCWFRQHRVELYLIAGLLLLSAAGTAVWLCTRQAGGRAVVSIAGEDVMTLPLDRDAQVVLGEGDHTNTLVIRDGAAAVTQASCPDQVCVRLGWILYQGETMVCLPHRLVVRIEGGPAPPEDAVTQ